MGLAAHSIESNFAQFVSEHETILRRFIISRLRDHLGDVDDVLQDGLLRIWNQFEQWPEDPDEQLRFAGRLMKQASVDMLRKRHGRNLQRRNAESLVFFSFVDDDDDDVDRGPVIDQLHQVIRRMHFAEHQDEGKQVIDAEGRLVAETDVELERRITTLNVMLVALKDVERDVLLAHHPAGENRNGKQVAEQLGITHGQARTHYMDAIAVLKPLIAHALAPELPAEEAAAALDYASGTMTDKRQRGRMKRHLRHCDACRALVEGEHAVVGATAAMLLPLPAVVGFAAKATVAGGAAGMGASTIAASTTGSAGVAAIGGGSGATGTLLAKTLVAAAALSAAASSVAVVEHRSDAPAKRRPAATRATPTSAPTVAATSVTTSAAPRVRPASRPPTGGSTRLHTHKRAQANTKASATPAATQQPQPSSPTTIPTVASSAPRTTAPKAPPPPDKPSSSFSQEFGP